MDFRIIIKRKGVEREMNWDRIEEFEIIALFVIFVFTIILGWWTNSISIVDIGVFSLIGFFAMNWNMRYRKELE